MNYVIKNFSKFYKWIRKTLSPGFKKYWPNCITADMVTIGRVVFFIPIGILFHLGYICASFLLYVWAVFCDFLDGMVAKIQGPTKRGAMLDAVCDKIFWILSTTIILSLNKYSKSSLLSVILLIGLTIILGLLETVLLVIRVDDYYCTIKNGARDRKLKAPKSGKIKFCLESIGTGALIVAYPSPLLHWGGYLAIFCFALAIPFAYLSLRHKLQARR